MLVDKQILSEILSRLVQGFDPEKIYLFGSFANGTADTRSDIDLLIVCRLLGKRREMMLQMDRALRGIPIARDIVILTPEEFESDKFIPGTIARPAWLEGELLYERG